MNTENTITTFHYPHGDKFMSAYGLVDYDAWLLFEQARMNTHGIKTKIRTDKKGRKALERID